MGYLWPDLPSNGALGPDHLSTAELVLYAPRRYSEVASWQATLDAIRSLPEVKR